MLTDGVEVEYQREGRTKGDKVWLVDFANDWGSFLNTPESITRESLTSFYDDPTFKVAVEDGGVLSWATPDIDKVEMVNEILNDDARAEYLASNEELLQDQTRVFYDSLISSIDPEIVTTYEFRS